MYVTKLDLVQTAWWSEGGGCVAEREEILQIQGMEAEFPCTVYMFSKNLHSLAAL